MSAIKTAARALKTAADEEARQDGEKSAEKTGRKAHTRDSLQALSKLAELVDGQYRIVSQPPIVVPFRDLAAERRLLGRRARARHPRAVPRLPGNACRTTGATCSSASRSSTWPARSSASAASARARSSSCSRVAIRTTRLFLQVKEATASVLEDHLPKSRYRQPGERVVQGQRMMQAASDIFLGWTKGVEANRYLYWRQLRDMKGSAVVETMAPGRARASTHASAVRRWRARTPDRATRSRSPRTSARRTGSIKSITDFSERYADQNERDYQAFTDAIRSGRLEALEGV